MRSLLLRHHPSRSLAAALAALLATTACEREITRPDAELHGARPRAALFTGTESGSAADINEHGEIVLNSASGPYRWPRGGAPIPMPAMESATVLDINNFGVAVGRISTSPLGDYSPAVWSPDGQVRILDDMGLDGTEAVAVNDAGMVAGAWYGASMRWSANGEPEVLPKAAQFSADWDPYYETALDINSAGDVLVRFEAYCEALMSNCRWVPETHYEGASVITVSGRVVRLQGSSELIAADLNDAGTVVGCNSSAPAIWSAAGKLRVIGPDGCAIAVSETGVVVGNRTVGGHTRAFRWTETGGMEDLGTLGGTSSNATDVNDSGDVTGYAQTADGVEHAFLWTPEQGMRVLESQDSTHWSRGVVLNNAREVGGSTRNPGGYSLPARWNDLASARPPVAHVGGPYPVRISGRRYVYTAAGSSDVDGPALRYSWDMNGDGVFDGVTNSPLFGYVYPAGGRYTVRLEVRDDGGRRDTATTTLSVVQNVAPVATVSGLPASAPEGGLLTATASVTDANQAADSTELGLLRYRWEWSDGYVSTGSVSRHRFPDEGSHSIRLIVTDAGGLADTVVRMMPVGNVAPTARFTTPTSIREGAPFTLTASALSDVAADVADGLQVSFSCGGGYGAYGTALSIVCPARPDQGTVTVGLRVRDQDGGGSGTTRAIPVGNVAPQVTAQATSTTTFAAGGTLSVSATFTDVAGDAPWRYRIYWGDGAYTLLTPVAAGATIKGSHTYAAPGSYAPYVAVVDKDGGSGRSAGISVTVTP